MLILPRMSSHFIIGTCGIPECGGPVSAAMNEGGLIAKQSGQPGNSPYCLNCLTPFDVLEMGKWGPMIYPEGAAHKGMSPIPVENVTVIDFTRL